MANQSKISDDTFDWVKDTSDSKKQKPKTSKKKASSTKEGKDTIFVKYKKEGGQIVALLKIIIAPDIDIKKPWLNVAGDEKVSKIAVPPKIAKQKLIEIHTGYIIDVKAKTPKLIPKQ